MKIFAPKIGLLSKRHDWTVAAAFAGHSAFAISAIQKCADALSKVDKVKDVLPTLEKVSAAEYRKTVHRHPDRK